MLQAPPNQNLQITKRESEAKIAYKEERRSRLATMLYALPSDINKSIQGSSFYLKMRGHKRSQEFGNSTHSWKHTGKAVIPSKKDIHFPLDSIKHNKLYCQGIELKTRQDHI